MNCSALRALKFCGFSIVGVISTLTSIGLIFIFNDFFNWHPQFSYAAAYLLTIGLSYYLNAVWVFHSPFIFRGLLSFLGVYLSGMFVGMGILKLYTLCLPDISENILSILVIPLTMIWNFFLVEKIMSWSFKKCQQQ